MDSSDDVIRLRSFGVVDDISSISDVCSTIRSRPNMFERKRAVGQQPSGSGVHEVAEPSAGTDALDPQQRCECAPDSS